MPKKGQGRPHGHYCKICGEYKAYEKFSGMGHANHICKACSKLSAEEKAEAQTITQLMNFHPGRLNESEKKWLENRVHDRRPEVASLAREVYNAHFPYAERNARKKQLLINTLTFELRNATVFDEYGDEYPVRITFTADRRTGVLTMTNFDEGSVEQSITLERKQMTKLLRWTIHTLEIFMWTEDYDLSPDDGFFDDPYLDILPEFRPDGWDDEDEEEDEDFSEPEEDETDAEIYWRVLLEYADEAEQEIVSYQDYLYDKPDKLFWTLMEYFTPGDDELDEDKFFPEE